MKALRNGTLPLVMTLLAVLAGCTSGDGRPRTTSLEIPIRFVMSGDECEGRVEKKDNDEAYVQRYGRITWRVVQNTCGRVEWDVADFREKNLLLCIGGNADQNFTPVDGGNPAVVRVRKVGSWVDTFCYDVKARWNNRDIDIDPELDVIY